MVRKIGTTFGMAIAGMCLVATVAMAQSASPLTGPGQAMTCTQDDGKGTCTAATGVDGKAVVVVGEGLEKGALMTCVDRGNVVNCGKVVAK